MAPKRKPKDDFVDDDEDGGDAAKPKKSSKRGASEDTVTICELGKKRKVQVNKYNGAVFIHIREMYTGKDGTDLPGKKGIALSPDQWETLKEHMEQVDEAIKGFED